MRLPAGCDGPRLPAAGSRNAMCAPTPPPAPCRGHHRGRRREKRASGSRHRRSTGRPGLRSVTLTLRIYVRAARKVVAEWPAFFRVGSSRSRGARRPPSSRPSWPVRIYPFGTLPSLRRLARASGPRVKCRRERAPSPSGWRSSARRGPSRSDPRRRPRTSRPPHRTRRTCRGRRRWPPDHRRARGLARG